MADNLTKKQRSYCMSQVKSKDTGLELVVRSAIHREGLRFRKHVADLPGRPDIVFPRKKVVVFIDGDFWHGYRFPHWKRSLSRFWQEKIEKNRKRDRSNFRKLRARGWQVIRLWQHQLKANNSRCIEKILLALE
jgi:DNA mismatch endonuclease (patch repair protein)